MKKKMLITGLVIIALIAVTGATFALFSHSEKSEFEADFGTVDIDINNINLTNPKTISPGNGYTRKDGDANHEFSFTVENKGSKSVKTRYTLLLSAKKRNKDINAKYMSLLKNGDELDKEYLNKHGEEVSASSDDIVAVRYRLDGDVFNGNGKDIKDGGNAEKENIVDAIEENNDGNVKKDYNFRFALSPDAKNDYQEADITIDVIAEALQYRNTEDNDFSDITVKKTYSTLGLDGKFVPANNEDKDGEEF